MTLEQLNNKQKALNMLFQQQLQELSFTVDRITGKEILPECTQEGLERETNGLIDEMSENLNNLETIIDKLLSVKQRLCEYTFAPGEMIQI